MSLSMAVTCFVLGGISFTTTVFFVLNSVFVSETANTVAAMASAILGSFFMLSPIIAGVSRPMSLTDYNIARIKSTIDSGGIK